MFWFFGKYNPPIEEPPFTHTGAYVSGQMYRAGYTDRIAGSKKRVGTIGAVYNTFLCPCVRCQEYVEGFDQATADIYAKAKAERA